MHPGAYAPGPNYEEGEEEQIFLVEAVIKPDQIVTKHHSTLPPDCSRFYFAIRHWFHPLRDVGTGLEPARLFHQCHGLLDRCTLQISRLSAVLLHYTV